MIQRPPRSTLFPDPPLSRSLPALAQDKPDRLSASDIFNLQFASDPQISPDGKRIVYVRAFADIMSDKRLSKLWVVDFDGLDNRSEEQTSELQSLASLVCRLL